MAMPMSDLPLPPELAAEAPPIPDGQLDQLLEQAVAEAHDGGIDPAQAVELLADSEGAPRWRITDLGGAEWAMRHVAAADQALAALQAQRQAWAERIDQWFAQAAGKEQARRQFFAGHLERYAIEQREATGGKAKSLALPSGVVRTTEAKPKAAVADEQAVVAWADSLAELLGAEAVEAIAPPQPRKVYVQPLREHTSVVEVVDRARLVLASGELVEWCADSWVPRDDDPAGLVRGAGRCPQPGDGWPNPEDATDLVAQVDVQWAHLEVHGPNGLPVPGARVEPGHVSAKVTAEQP
jgi:hypothetical protein